MDENTFIPLDVLYFNENKQIKEMKENMKPKNLNSYKTKNKYRYALEINGGTIKKKNIQLGDFVNLEKLRNFHKIYLYLIHTFIYKSNKFIITIFII